MFSLNKTKAVKIMCDWCADGIWSNNQVPNSTLDGFRVSEGLWARLQRWQRWYEQQDPSLDINTDPNFDLERFIIEGYMIAKAVKAELPSWIVHYSDEALLIQSIEDRSKAIPHLIEIPSELQ